MLEITSKKNKEGQVIYECYTFKDCITAQKYYYPSESSILHRNSSEGPALVLFYYPSGEILCEKYYHLGKLHRSSEEGPALIRYLKDGRIDKVEFWVYGEIEEKF